MLLQKLKKLLCSVNCNFGIISIRIQFTGPAQPAGAVAGNANTKTNGKLNGRPGSVVSQRRYKRLEISKLKAIEIGFLKF